MVREAAVRQVGVLEMKTHLSELLDGVEYKGEDFVITRHGRPIARLSAYTAAIDRRPSGEELLEQAIAIREAIREDWRGHTAFDWKSAVEEGRE